jgi:primosomal protein N' (replication factor Y)
MSIVRVALPVRLDRLFDYLPGADFHMPEAGCRVEVPFGRRKLIGMVVELADTASVPRDKLKRLIRVCDREALLSPDLFDLGHWLHGYYHHPLGDVFATMMPSWLRSGRSATFDPCWQWRLTDEGSQVDPDAIKRAPRQADLLLALGRGPVAESDLRAMPGITGSVLGRLQQRGWIEREPLSEQRPSGDSAPTLNEAQQKAVKAVSESLGGFQSFLLDGVTGSGKTEVYLGVIERLLAQGRQSLVIVPEIGLTPQLTARFRGRLNARIGVWHSGVSDGERLDLWARAKAGELDLVLGTRSAVFIPLVRPGLIVVDEEHDASLKQQDGLRYSARDVAVQRARMLDVPVVLGSATPSLESMNNVAEKRYRRLPLPARAGGAAPPRLELIDLRGQHEPAGLSNALVAAVRDHTERGGQVLLFLNRRGYSPVLMCRACGWFAECRRCDSRLTLHLGERRLRCHHCDHRQPMPAYCPECNADQLEPLGVGTERLADSVQALFEGIDVLRMDRDTVRRKSAWDDALQRLATGEPCILLGTQMLAKGHDYPNITLVGVVNLDQSLFSSDFRATERAAQLLVQVAGRAGRAEKPGTVMVQTHHPEHPLFNQLFAMGYSRFAASLLDERRAAGYPPYGFMALLRAESARKQPLEQFMNEAVGVAPESETVNLLGPLPAPMERRAGRYRMQILVLAASRAPLHRLLHVWMPRIQNLNSAKRVRWSMDIDPSDTF